MLNLTKPTRVKQAVKDFRLKLTHERNLYKNLKPIFNKYSKDFLNIYTATGLLPDNRVLTSDLQKTLQSHYANVADDFSKRIVKELGIPDNHNDVLNSMQNRFNYHHDNRAKINAGIITDTTHKDMINAINSVTQDAFQAGQILTKQEIAKRAQLKLDQKITGRLPTISATETQNPAEHAKQTEIDSLHFHDSNFEDQSFADAKKQKQWIAILDNVTREWHVEADGQIVDFDDYYIVEGQKLMYPGDISLGATIDNTINCRCSSVPIISAE